MLGDFLYALSPRDMQSQGIVPIQRQGGTNGTSVTLSATLFDVPEDTLFIPLAVAYGPTPGASQFVITANMRAYKPNPTPQQFIEWGHTGAPFTAGQAAARQDLGWSSSNLFIPPGFRIDVVARFTNPATNLNEIFCTLYGVLVPRGNVGLP